MEQEVELEQSSNQSTLWEEKEFDEGDEGDSELDNARDSIQSYKYSHQYIPGQGFSKYKASLKNFIPVRREKKKKNNLGVDEAGLWSFLTFSWLSKYIYKSYRKGLTLDDIPELSPFDTSELNGQRLESLWHDEVSRKGTLDASLAWVTWRFMRTRIIVASLLFLLYLLLCFISIAFFMRELLEFAESENASFWDGIKCVVLLTVNELLRVTLYSLVWAINYRTAIRLRSACLSMIYRKILRLSYLQNKTIGELVNLFSIDGQRVFDLVLFGPMIIGGPFSLFFCLFYVYWLMGLWAAIGLLSFLIFYPLQYILSRFSGLLRMKALVFSDKRINLMSEIIASIKFIKLNVWNDCFFKKILCIRKKELLYVKVMSFCQSLSTSMSSTAPIISGIVTFLLHLASGSPLLASQAFTVISLNHRLLRNALNFTRNGFKSIIDFLFSVHRFKSVLVMSETKTFLSQPLDKSQAVCIADGHFSKYKLMTKVKKKRKERNLEAKAEGEDLIAEISSNKSDLQEILHGINFFAPKGKLIGICGQVGSGKSSLLQAIMGHLPMTAGKLCREGSCAYVSQEAWLMNASLKENIIFGEKFMAKKYYNSLYSCDLNEDINRLPGGDQTEIGDRGITLSGGQKQRICLARALYSDRDIYLLDDPFSAVDSEVGAHLFERCICTSLKEKTVILVTHQVEFLRKCDEIVVMKGGQCVEIGTYEELLLKGGLKDMMPNEKANIIQEKTKYSEGASLNGITSNLYQAKEKDFTLAQCAETSKITGKPSIEHGLKGSIQFHTIIFYMKACGGFILSALVALLILFNVGSMAFSSWWLAHWIKTGSVKWTKTGSVNSSVPESENVTQGITFENPGFTKFQLVYCLCIIVILVTNFLRGFFVTMVTVKASSALHNKVLDKAFKSSMSFFETTPIGRLQNIFSKDIDEVETRLPTNLESLIQDVWQIVFAVIFISLAFPFFLIPVIFLALLYYLLSKVFRMGIREMKRLENLSRSPIFSTVSSTCMGLETIKAFGKEKPFLQKFSTYFDQNTACLFMNSIGGRWLAVRLDAVAVLVTLITASLVVILHGSVPPALAGLAVAYAASISGLFQFTIRQLSECEMKFLSVERINLYINKMEQEGGSGKQIFPPETWPEIGTIAFRNVFFRYRPELPFALDNVSFKINDGEKIGIVGRTGSGKSSLVSSLFRLAELTSGKIKVGNIDVATLNLYSLRSRLTIIPQDPVLFSGSIRHNLDPVEHYSDATIWTALEKTNLKNKVASIDKKIDAYINSTNNSFSGGEKQLLCLARALLKDSKIIIMDEATSGVDPETQNLVQETLMREFRHCTLLIIAHRLETITSCNRILVMENGKVVEFDEPTTLMADTNSYYFKLLSGSETELRI